MFDMGELVKNNCGTRIGDRIQFTRDEEEYEEYGVTQCKKFISLTYIARIGVFLLRSLLYPCLSAPAENFPSVVMNISIEIRIVYNKSPTLSYVNFWIYYPFAVKGPLFCSFCVCLISANIFTLFGS